MAFTVHQQLEALSKEYPDRDALVIGDVRVSYSELASQADRAARALAAIGVKPGDKVGTLLVNYPEMVSLMFAAGRLGAVWVPLSTRYKREELQYVLDHSQIKALIVTDRIEQHVPLVQNLLSLTGPVDSEGRREDRSSFRHLERIICLSNGERDDMLDYHVFLTAGDGETPPAPDVRAGDAFTILYTSGTTANPKGVLLNHSVFTEGMEIIARDRLLMESGESVYGPLPLYHLAGYIPLMCALTTGGTWVSLSHFEAERAARLVQQERCTSGWPAFENVISPLLEEPIASKFDLSSLRVCSVIGPPSLMRRLSERLPTCSFVQPYGSTEMGGAISLTLPTDDLETRIGTAGRPLPGVEVAIKGEDGSSLERGQIGEICARGDRVTLGYFRDEEQTGAAFDREGFFHGGDLGYVNDRGEIVFTGRLKELIKVGGENVAAAEVENLLLSHPRVRNVAVVGVPDAKYTEVPAAFIEPVPDEPLDEEEVRAFCQERMSRFKVPRHIRFVAEWPMSATKIHKPTLRNRLVEELGLSS